MSTRALLAAPIAAVPLAGTAAGYTAGRVFTVRPGDSADFSDKNGSGVNGWRCNNVRGRYAECFSGDAHPYVRLTGTTNGGVTVKVYTLLGLKGGSRAPTSGASPCTSSPPRRSGAVHRCVRLLTAKPLGRPNRVAVLRAHRKSRQRSARWRGPRLPSSPRLSSTGSRSSRRSVLSGCSASEGSGSRTTCSSPTTASRSSQDVPHLA
jgi:hypothetical protein